MHNTSFLHCVSGRVSEIPTPNRAIISFELDGLSQTAFLKSQRFYKDGKHLPDHQNLMKFLRIGHQVKFSCHINDNSQPGHCQWFVTNCWKEIEGEQKLTMLCGMMNVAGTVTNLEQRHGTLLMTDLSGNEYKVYFLASKVYLFGKRLPSSKTLFSELLIDDKLYFDAIPCFPRENIHNCDWFATSVHKGKKPEISYYKDSCNTEANEIDKEKIFAQFTEYIKAEDKPIENDTPTNHIDFSIDEINTNVDKLSLNANQYPVHSQRSNECEQTVSSPVETVLKQQNISEEENQTSETSSVSEIDLFKNDFNLKVEPSRLNDEMLHDIKLLTNDPRTVFAKSEGIILDIINEEYGVILGEFQRNVFQSILFHRRNAFLFKMSLAHTKLSEIFIEGDRVQFIAVDAPRKFFCDWIATQVSVAWGAQEEQDDLDDDDDDLSDDFID